MNLNDLVKSGKLKEGDRVYYVANKNSHGSVFRNLAGNYTLFCNDLDFRSPERFVAQILGMDPPGHAFKWLKNDRDVTLYDLWYSDEN